MGYYELRPKQEQVIRHSMRGNDGFISLPTGSRKSLCYSLLLWSFQRSFIFNSTVSDQGNTPPPFSQFMCCLKNWNCIPSLWHLMTLPTLNSSMSWKPVLVTRRSFPPPPHATNVCPVRLDTHHRLTTATLEYSKFILSTSYSVLPRIILECSPPFNYCYSKFGTG